MFRYSIAYSVLQKLSQQGCRVLFATHYHMLTEEFKGNKEVALKHMAVLIDKKYELSLSGFLTCSLVRLILMT